MNTRVRYLHNLLEGDEAQTGLRGKNQKMCVCLMGADPLRTSTNEPLSALQLLTGQRHKHLEGSSGFSLVVKLRGEYMKRGMRHNNNPADRPECILVHVEFHVPEHVAQQIEEAPTTLEKERLLIAAKMDYMEAHPEVFVEKPINPVHFTIFVDGPIDQLMERVRDNKAFKHVKKTRNRRCTGTQDEFTDWLKHGGHLFASKPWSYVRDRSQKLSNTLVLWGPGYTPSDWEQAMTRIWRRGSKFDKVQVIIPLALNVKYDCNRYLRMCGRKDLLKLLQNGEVPGAVINRIAKRMQEDLVIAKTALLGKVTGEKVPAPALIPSEHTIPPVTQYTHKRPIYALIHSRMANSFSKNVVKAFQGGKTPCTTEQYFESMEQLTQRWKKQWDDSPESWVVREARKLNPKKKTWLLNGATKDTLRIPVKGLKITYLDLLCQDPKIVNADMTVHRPEWKSKFGVQIASLCLYIKTAPKAIAEIAFQAAPDGEVWIVKSAKRDSWYHKNLPRLLKANGFRPAKGKDFVYTVWEEFKIYRAVKK